MASKAIFFDLDGTLTDSGEGIINCAIYAMEHYGVPIPPREELRVFVGPPLTDTFMKFGIKPEDEIFYIKRLCYGDNEPVSLEEIYIPKNLIPKIAGIDLSIFSIYEVYELYGINLERAYQTVDLVHLEQNDARMLGIDSELPVMLFECTSYDDRGRVIEHSHSYTRGDKCRFHVRFKR